MALKEADFQKNNRRSVLKYAASVARIENPKEEGT